MMGSLQEGERLQGDSATRGADGGQLNGGNLLAPRTERSLRGLLSIHPLYRDPATGL